MKNAWKKLIDVTRGVQRRLEGQIKVDIKAQGNIFIIIVELT